MILLRAPLFETAYTSDNSSQNEKGPGTQGKSI